MNLFKRTTATVALVALVSGVFSTSVSAYNPSEFDAANSLATKGFINQQASAADYNLTSTITRGEIAKVAANVAGISPLLSCEGKFSDVSATVPNTWVCGYVEALLAAGKVSANAEYNSERNLSKAEALKLMLEAANHTGIYTDASKWQEQVVAYAVTNEVISTSFSDYNTSATRGWVFAVADTATTEEDSIEDILGDIMGTEDTTTPEVTTPEVTTPEVIGDAELVVSLSPETPDNGTVAAGVTRTPVLAFDVTAGSEDVTLKQATLEFSGLGEESDMENLAFYIGNNKVTKQDSRVFDSENEADLSFEKDTVIKAGETKTIVVTSTIKSTAADVLQTLRVSLVSLEASTEVEGAELDGANLTPIKVNNKAAVEIKSDKASDDVVVGEVVSLAGFKLEETSDKEDVVVKSLTFTVSGSIDAEDDLTDLELLADGEVIASNLFVNDDDEVIVDLDYTIPADERIEFELTGVVTGSINNTIEMVFTNSDDIYVVGAKTGISLDVTGGVTTTDLANVKTIEGSEINVAFDKSDIDEAKPNAEEVMIGTLTMSTEEDYTIDRITVTVENTTDATDVATILSELELGGTSYDSANTGSTVVYNFDDITLSDEEKVLELTADIEDNTAFNNTDLKFTIKIDSVTDEENDESYNSTTVSKVLSSNSFNSKTVSIESASFELTASNVTARDLVLGNGIEVVLYKGKVSVGDSDNVTVNDLVFSSTGVTSLSNASTFKDIFDDVELNIGGKTFDGDINTTSIDFTSVNAEIEAGADNVELLVTAVLSDHDGIASDDKVQLEFTSITLEDTEGEDLVAGNIKTAAANTYMPELTLNEEGTFEIAVVNDGENEDEIEAVVLAGTNSVALAEVELEAEDEDIKVKELAFKIAGTDFTSTLENVKLVAGSKTIAEGAVVTYDTTDTFITFKDDFIVEEADDKLEAVLVADLNTVTTEGGEVSATLGDIQIEIVALNASDVKGVSSNEEIAVDYDMSSIVNTSTVASATSTAVAVVPALVTVSVVNGLGNEDQYAKIRFDIDKGNNDLDSDDVAITQIDMEALVASGVVLRNDDNAGIALDNAAADPLVLTVAEEINNGDEFEFKVSDDNDEIRIVANGISFTINNETYTISNDKVIDLGQYTTDNN